MKSMMMEDVNGMLLLGVKVEDTFGSNLKIKEVCVILIIATVLLININKKI